MYARDVLDIDPFSSVKGVEMDGSDNEFAGKFSTGAVSRPWQEEVCCSVWCPSLAGRSSSFQMLEKKAFDEINGQSPIEGMTLSYGGASVTRPAESGQGWLSKVFKWKRSVSHV